MVSKQALKRSVGTTSLLHWQMVKNKFLNKPMKNIGKEKIFVAPSACSGLEKTTEESSETNTERGKDKHDEKLHETSRVSEIKRTLRDRLAKSPVPDTPPTTPSPSPTRKYKWIQDGGIWKKKFLSDSGESGSEVEDYGKEDQNECVAKLLLVNRSERSVDGESSSEGEGRPFSASGPSLLGVFGPDNEVEADEWDDKYITKQETYVTNDNICVETVEFEAVRSQFDSICSLYVDEKNVKTELESSEIRPYLNEVSCVHTYKNELEVDYTESTDIQRYQVSQSDADTKDCCDIAVTMDTDLLDISDTDYDNLDESNDFSDSHLGDNEDKNIVGLLDVSKDCVRTSWSQKVYLGETVDQFDHTQIKNTEETSESDNTQEDENLTAGFEDAEGKNVADRGDGIGGEGSSNDVCEGVEWSASRLFTQTASPTGHLDVNTMDKPNQVSENTGHSEEGTSVLYIDNSDQEEMSGGHNEKPRRLDEKHNTLKDNCFGDASKCNEIEMTLHTDTTQQVEKEDMNIEASFGEDVKTSLKYKKFNCEASALNVAVENLQVLQADDNRMSGRNLEITLPDDLVYADNDGSTSSEPNMASDPESSSLGGHSDLDNEDQSAVLAEIQEKFIPIEASPILRKKCLELNSVGDQVLLSAAENVESDSISREPVKPGWVTGGQRLEAEQGASETEDIRSDDSCSVWEDNEETFDDDLDTTMTDDGNDDLCDLVISEDLDNTVVGAEGGNDFVDLRVEDDKFGPCIREDQEMDKSYSFTSPGHRIHGYMQPTHDVDSGYWQNRKAFWEKDSHELLAEISELEESFDAAESAQVSETENLQSEPQSEPQSAARFPENQGGTTPRLLQRKKSGRRSLSLPSGTLSYGDVKISYVDGHFVAEPPEQPEEPVVLDERTKTHTIKISCGTSSESIDGSNSDTLSVVSDLAIRDELLSLLNQHLVDSDVLYSQSLDWNYNLVGSDSSAHSSQSSLGLMPASATLPRRTGRDNDGHRPVSVDDIQLLRSAYFQSQGQTGNGGQAQARTWDGVNQDSDPRIGRRRLSVQEDKSERSRSKSPNFFQRMLSKRKSFSEKGVKMPPDEQPPRKDTSIVRRMSLKSLFKRKVRKGSDEQEGPPIATFLKNEDIGAVSSLPNSPFVSKRVQRVHTDPQIQVRKPVPSVSEDDHLSASALINQSITSNTSRAVLTRPDIPPRRRQSSSSSVKLSSQTDRSSGEYSICDYDTSFDDSVMQPSSPSLIENDCDVTLVSSTVSRESLTSNQNRSVPRQEQMSPQEFEKVSGQVVRGEITASNSNDSGIQHDAVILSSCESLKVSPDTSTPVNIAVKLRKTPSPKQERPKSDITVRWADLVQQVKDTDITYRQDGRRVAKRPRPKSDLGGSTLFTDTMRAFGSIGNLQSSDSLRSLRLVDGIQVEFRRSSQDDRVVAAKLVKSRRMSTPHPIKTRTEKSSVSHTQTKVAVMVRSHSMPENLDKLHRKKNLLSLIGSDSQSIYSQRSGGDDSSDESEYSVELTLHDKCPSTRSSQMALATLDETQEEETMTYAEALWDHVTMDPDELGFRAGDQIRVTDMLDKDWWFGCTEQHRGWFPAAFVRLWVNQERFEEDMITQDTELPKIRNMGVNTNQGRANVVNEIIHAEREYVKHLRDVVEGYLKQARKRPEMFPEEKISIIFGNVEDIYNFATRFLSCLEKAFISDSPHVSTIGQVFLLHSKCFEIYSDYCNNHPGSGEVVKELYRNKRYRHFFEACRLLQEMIEIPLEGFLLTPVQKICKYHLQLNELLKYTPPDHPDYPHVKAALESMKQIATLINERKRKMESIEKIAVWQASVDDWEGEDILQQSSELIYSGELNKINSSGWSQERYFFLFDHQIVYCKKDLLKKNSFCYKGRIDLDHSDIIPLSDGKDAQYNVSVRHAWKVHDTMRDKWYLLVAKSDKVKQRWLKAFEDERKRVKDDQENNFNIPLHVKQTAINNIRQKSHLAKPKGKRKAARSTSLRHSKKPEPSFTAVSSIQGTLPRRKQQDSLGDINQSKKLTWFFLGQGKKK